MIHVVDLNGAVEGHPVHLAELAAICAESGVAVEVGGGLRNLEAVAAGHGRGGGAGGHRHQGIRGPGLPAGGLPSAFPGRVVVGIDARGGKVAVRGWRDDTAMDAVELARRCEQDGAAQASSTRISAATAPAPV